MMSSICNILKITQLWVMHSCNCKKEKMGQISNLGKKKKP